jgi:hypothetical protein
MLQERERNENVICPLTKITPTPSRKFAAEILVQRSFEKSNLALIFCVTKTLLKNWAHLAF